MSAATHDLAVGSAQERVESLRARLRPLLDSIAEGAAEREASRELVGKEIHTLAREGASTVRVPREHGGLGGSVRDVFTVIMDIAEADSNVAHAMRPHFAFVEGLMRGRDDRAAGSRWFPEVLRGAVFGNANNEIGAPDGVHRTTIRKAGDHFVVSGKKFYSTGAFYADWISISAVDEDEARTFFILPRDREGLELIDDWDGMGQRMTVSGTTILRNVHVYPEEMLSRTLPPGVRTHGTAFVQLYLAAVETGIARNVLKDARRFAIERSRPIKHSVAKRSVDDPFIQHAVGEIAARALASEAIILRAAQAIDAVLATPVEDSADIANEAAVTVAQAQMIAAESSLRAAQLIFDVGGGSATRSEFNFDRHWRNARTLVSHNPMAYKAKVVGDYILNGTEPPTSGLF